MTKTADRVLAVLQLFTMAEPEWTVEAAARRLDAPTSTVYRYFRSLVDAGLIVNFTAGRYVIGPAIIELDRQTRHLDPLITAAQPTMAALVGGGRAMPASACSAESTAARSSASTKAVSARWRSAMSEGGPCRSFAARPPRRSPSTSPPAR